MGSKRDHTELSYSETESTAQPSSKRQRNQTAGKAKAQEPKTDLTYGQRCVFPGLIESTIPIDDDFDFEDEADALAYLRSVRTEANEIPHLLVAPKAGPQLPPHLESTGGGADRSIYQSEMGDARGYYYDGAYTAAPDAIYSDDEGEFQDGDKWTSRGGAHKTDASTETELRDAYFASLTNQFTALRSRLHKNPPTEALDALPENHETEVGFFGAKSSTFRKWTQRLRYTDPLPAQVAAMDRQSALRLLRILLGGKFLRRGIELRERTSRWIWALLARLPDRGELDHVEVGWIRELGKRAVLMMVSIAQMAALRDEVEGELDGEKFQDDDDNEDIDEEFLGELHPDFEDGEHWVENKPAKQEAPSRQDDEEAVQQNTDGTIGSNDVDVNGTAGDEGEANMDLDMEDGEVTDESTTAPSKDKDADIAAVKARLLAQLDCVEAQDESVVHLKDPELDAKGNRPARAVDANNEEAYDQTRARVNMRATLNMILTVAGEFYGQRDLLEFRDPFTGL